MSSDLLIFPYYHRSRVTISNWNVWIILILVCWFLGQYQCFATNEWGTATSNSVFVRKAELNSFKEQGEKSESANEGEPFKLTCEPPDGWPKPNVYWLIQVLSVFHIRLKCSIQNNTLVREVHTFHRNFLTI